MSPMFEVHKLNEVGMVRAKKLAEWFDELLKDVEGQSGGESRALSLCRTKLEEACFYAKKAMAENKENQA